MGSNFYNLIVTNSNGEQLELQPNKYFTIESIQGLSPPPASISGIPLGSTDGQTLSNLRIDTRTITINLYINGPNVVEQRMLLYKYFKIKDLIRLDFSHTKREVFIEGFVETLEIDLFAMHQIAQITIKCLDPYFKSKYMTTSYLSMTEKMFEYPFEHPDYGKVISELAELEADAVVYNNGDIETGCDIRVYAKGYVTGPIYIFDALDPLKQMSIELNLYEEDILLINTNNGEKSVVINRSGKIHLALKNFSKHSSWLTLKPGRNVLAYGAEQGKELLDITILHYDKYMGV